MREWSRISFNTDTHKKKPRRRRKKKPPTLLVTYFIFFSYHYHAQKAWPGLFFLVHRIEYRGKKWERDEKKKKNYYTHEKKEKWKVSIDFGYMIYPEEILFELTIDYNQIFCTDCLDKYIYVCIYLSLYETSILIERTNRRIRDRNNFCHWKKEKFRYVFGL